MSMMKCQITLVGTFQLSTEKECADILTQSLSMMTQRNVVRNWEIGGMIDRIFDLILDIAILVFIYKMYKLFWGD